MGCWNATCALTHLPIMVGEPVVMLMLALLDTVPGQCYYYNDDASLFALPVEGKYDDYGGLEDIQMSDVTRQMLKDTTFYSCSRDNEYTAIEATDEMDIFRYLQEQDLFIKHPMVGGAKVRYKYTPISCVMYHKGAYELIRDGIYHRITANDKGAYGTALYSKLQKKWDKNWRSRERRATLMERWRAENKDNPGDIPEYILELSEPVEPVWGTIALGYKFCPVYETTIWKHKELDNEQFLRELVNYVCFAVGLDLTRRSFFGLCGMGSQNTERYLHKKLAEWTLNHIQNRMDEDDTEESLKNSLFLWD